MDLFLGKITQHAMNYAIRSGIGITASFAIQQTTRLLKTVDDNTDYEELQTLQECLDGKIRIISPAIDMIELISARGNTTLECAVTLTKALRWDIQSLGIRLEKAAAAGETSRRKSTRAKSQEAHHLEIRHIVKDIKKLLLRIEDAVPLINLAITTSGAIISTKLPDSVSPSRLLQASTLLTYGDRQYAETPWIPMQIGPTLTLSLYMLFVGHASTEEMGRNDPEGMKQRKEERHRRDEREMSWKEVIHKAQIKLLRIPLHPAGSSRNSKVFNYPTLVSTRGDGEEPSLRLGKGRANEYCYQIQIIEDLDDGRVHTFDDDEPQPGSYEGVLLAGIREILPIHQVSKIFYADTGKILNIGNQGEPNCPVLLLKRDVNALPPNRMMEEEEKRDQWYADPEGVENVPDIPDIKDDDDQDALDQQIRKESSAILQDQSSDEETLSHDNNLWRFPPDLDPEWLAFEIYTEVEDTNSDDDEEEVVEDAAYISNPAESPSSESFTKNLESLNLSEKTPPSSPKHSPAPTYKLIPTPKPRETISPAPSPSPIPSRLNPTPATATTPYGPTRSSLSLLEMLIRLTALQQFQQSSHLSIPDEFLTFFLSESSTTGGTSAEGRRQTRYEARKKVGFDPYDDSPVKIRGEEYQYRSAQGYESPHVADEEEYSRAGSPYTGFENYDPVSPSWPSVEPRRRGETPDPWLLRSREGVSRGATPEAAPESPSIPYKPVRKATRPLQRVQQDSKIGKREMVGSPLGRGISAETGSTLGTSPGTSGSLTLVERGVGTNK